jgi:cobalt/nickel transport protein
MENPKGNNPGESATGMSPGGNQQAGGLVEGRRGKAPMATRTFLAMGIIIALLIGIAAVFLASPAPDGLESTALIVQGQKTLTGGTPADAEIHEDMTGKFSYSPPMPEYSLGEEMGTLGGIIAIVVGTLLAFVIVLGTIFAVKYFSRPKGSPVKP